LTKAFESALARQACCGLAADYADFADEEERIGTRQGLWVGFRTIRSPFLGACHLIGRIQHVRSIGQFDAVAADTTLSRLTLIYAENGRGKTTLAAILRSLASGDPIPISERRRLGADRPPHVVVGLADGTVAVFQDNVWSRRLENVLVFDDLFVDQNVCSGLDVDPEHRQNLHELVLGEEGVVLNRTLLGYVQQIERHNAELRTKESAIPLAERGPFNTEQFCNLLAQEDIDARIQTSERELQAVRQQEPIRETPSFEEIVLPEFSPMAIGAVLQRDLEALDTTAVAMVQSHLASLAGGAEAWIAQGMRYLSPAQDGPCPFCSQDLGGSPVINHYRAYFSEAYAALKEAVAGMIAEANRLHGGGALAAFERAVRIWSERRQFWTRFCGVPEVALDTLEITRSWQRALDVVTAALQAKQAAPLDRMNLSEEAIEVIAVYERHRLAVAATSEDLQRANEQIRLVKEQAAGRAPAAIAADVARLRAVKARHEPGTAAFCQDYLQELAAKRATERRRDEARTALEQYRATIFPRYEASINDYLRRFNVGFTVGSVAPTNTRAGSACNYCVVINGVPVAVDGAPPVPGEPCFRTTLSSGDRNALALAFFFASTDQDPALADRVVIIDDPISSLDEHRSLNTVQEIRRLAERVSQVIVLSHNKPFLCRIWEQAAVETRCALQVARSSAGSAISEWNVNQDCVTEHDRRHELLREFVINNIPDNREVAKSIRPHLEAYLRVAFPGHFVPGSLVGPFIGLCNQRLGTPGEILDASDLRELNELNEYARQFHHGGRGAQVPTINDSELASFVRRTLDFVRKRK
jgi:wobble nucleotide-excising tRNase